MTLSANTVLITGASRGIGAATAVAAARNGFDVAINYIADEEAAQSVVNDVLQYGCKAIAVQGDVSIADDVRRMFSIAEESLGPLAGLVNNAGLTGRIGPFTEAAPATIERVFAVNVFGTMQCARMALDCFARRKQTGIIVNISSIAAHTGSPNEYVHYAASKAAVETFTLGLAREVASSGIRVCAVAPGSTLTDIHATAGEPDRPERIAGKIPMGRLAYPSEIAETIVWLLSPAASYVTGRVLHCSGGL
ncbi:MAG TPA: SDR family oxidoreductase [Eoetvoesiella sp.]